MPNFTRLCPNSSPFLVAILVLVSALIVASTTSHAERISSFSSDYRNNIKRQSRTTNGQPPANTDPNSIQFNQINTGADPNYVDGGGLTLNAQQQMLVSQHPGSLQAVARALKMVIFECQHQMRNEPWDCPVYGFSVKPTVMFGKLMSRNFKESSFVHALMSAAITHSITRACTDRMISTCGWLVTSDGGYSEDVNFGIKFSEKFMNATHDTGASVDLGSHDASMVMANSVNYLENNQQQQQNPNYTNLDRHSYSSSSYNDILPNSIGVSSSASASASASAVDVYHHGKRKKTNDLAHAKTRSTRSTRSSRAHINFHNDEVGRHLVFNGKAKKCKCIGVTGSCSYNICWNKLPSFRDVANKLRESLDQAVKMPMVSHGRLKRAKGSKPLSVRSPPPPPPSPTLNQTQTFTNSSALIKRRPVARSIAEYEPATRATTYNSLDLLYTDDSPDFCVSNDGFDIKGTKDRVCSADKSSANSCDRLCCGRGYKTEKREEKYKCECQFKYCCELKCNTCTQQKIIYKCL